MDHHPLGRVEDKRMCKLNAIQGPAQLRTEVGGTGVGGVNMQPQLFFCTCAQFKGTESSSEVVGRSDGEEGLNGGSSEGRTDWSKLCQIVEGTHSCGPQCHTQLKGERNTDRVEIIAG